MLFNEIPTAFPFYDKIQKQDRFNPNVDERAGLYKFISPTNAIPPFQLFTPNTWTPNVFRIYDAATDSIFASVAATPVRSRSIAGGKYWYYDGSTLTRTPSGALSLEPNNYYYAVFGNGSDLYYSEIFFVPSCTFTAGATDTEFLRIEWYNKSDIAPLFYNDLTGGVSYFKNRVYLDTFIHEPEEEIIVEGTPDGNGTTIETFTKVIRRRRITDVVPGYLKTALMLLPLHDVIHFTTPGGVRSGTVERVTVESQSEEGGALFTVTIVLEDTVAMVKKGCANNMQ